MVLVSALGGAWRIAAPQLTAHGTLPPYYLGTRLASRACLSTVHRLAHNVRQRQLVLERVSRDVRLAAALSSLSAPASRDSAPLLSLGGHRS